MLSQFNTDRRYFAYISAEGKLKIWNTLANSLDQEFTPDYHLTSPCTCLNFVEVDFTKSKPKSPTPKKKKRKISESSDDLLSLDIALGTRSGLLIVYSVLKGNINYTINSETNQPINCLSNSENILYSGIEQYVYMWNLSRRMLIEKWKAGEEIISAILAIPETSNILTASKSIKMWDISKKDLLRSFTGHSSEIISLNFLSQSESENGYIMSASKNDRILSCWNLNSSDKNAVASFLMEDVLQNVVIESSNNFINMAATVRSGVVHLYQYTLNGKSNKPLKPKSTVQVVSYSETNNKDVIPLKIVGASYRTDESLCIGYGTERILTFENIAISTNKKMQCLVRKDPARRVITKQEQSLKTVTPVVNNDVHYFTPEQTGPSITKRKNDLQAEIPMEERLENLTLNNVDGNSKVPKANNMVQLLVQGLHSKDKNILKMVLYKKDDDYIRNTVKKLPVTVFVPLIRELNSLIQGKTLSSQIGSLWLRHILQAHSGLLISNPELPELIGKTLGNIEVRLGLLTPLTRLKGRLDLLLPQVGHMNKEYKEDEEPLFNYNDRDSNESDNEEVQLETNSDSENEWEEEEDEGEGEEHIDNNVGSDSDSS